MPRIRPLLLLPILLPLCACGGSSPIQDSPAALQEKFAAEHIYFAGRPAAVAGETTRVAAVTGLSCRDALIGVHATIEGALADLKKKLDELQKKPKGQNASAIVDVACYDTSPLIAYESKPFAYKGCWPGVYCKGEAVR